MAHNGMCSAVLSATFFSRKQQRFNKQVISLSALQGLDSLFRLLYDSISSFVFPRLFFLYFVSRG
jgi:hypothetical protein